MQATETVKLVLGIGEPLIGRLLTYDALGMRFREVRLRRDPNCPLCGTAPKITDLSIHRGGGDACAETPVGADSARSAHAEGGLVATRVAR